MMVYWSDIRHTVRKLRSTAVILFRLGMARTFGQYRHSIYDNGLNYAVYKWRDQWWAFPTEPFENKP